MEIFFYRYGYKYNVVNKTGYLLDEQRYEGYLRDGASITEPVITIQTSIFNYNYAYIPKFGRYYFVNEIRALRTDVFEVDLSVDVLMTYRNDLLGTEAFIDRNEYETNPLLIDKNRIFEQGYDVEEGEINNDLFFNYQRDISDDAETELNNTPCIVINGYGLIIQR